MKGVGLRVATVVFTGIFLLSGCGGLGCFQVSGRITHWNYHI